MSNEPTGDDVQMTRLLTSADVDDAGLRYSFGRIAEGIREGGIVVESFDVKQDATHEPTPYDESPSEFFDRLTDKDTASIERIEARHKTAPEGLSTAILCVAVRFRSEAPRGDFDAALRYHFTNEYAQLEFPTYE